MLRVNRTWAVFAMIAIGVGGSEIAAHGRTEDWRLQAFDRANAAFLENCKRQSAFIVEKEPRLERYETKFFLPMQAAAARFRRLVFEMGLKKWPWRLKMDASPWVWALDMPSSHEKIVAICGQDKTGRIQQAYDSLVRIVIAIHSERKMLNLRNAACVKYSRCIFAIDAELEKKLSKIEDYVRGRLRPEDLNRKAGRGTKEGAG